MSMINIALLTKYLPYCVKLFTKHKIDEPFVQNSVISCFLIFGFYFIYIRYTMMQCLIWLPKKVPGSNLPFCSCAVAGLKTTEDLSKK